MLYDHIDLRVSSLAKVRELYDALLPAMGFSRLEQDDEDVNYHRPQPDRSGPFFGLMQDSQHRPNGTRTAFRANSRSEVDRLAQIAHEAGARAFEPPAPYSAESPSYYAAFFEDADGNKLEICFRE